MPSAVFGTTYDLLVVSISTNRKHVNMTRVRMQAPCLLHKKKKEKEKQRPRPCLESGNRHHTRQILKS